MNEINLVIFGMIMIKSVFIFNRYSKWAALQLVNSDEYTQLCLNDPKVAMELGPLFLQWS